MTTPRFVQIHFMKDFAAALANRDDSGMHKRMAYGGAVRARISSQCLKYHLRNTEDEYSLYNIPGVEEAVRSRLTVEQLVMGPIREAGEFDPEVVQAVETAFHLNIYGKNAAEKDGRQPLLLGMPEIVQFRVLAEEMCRQHPEDKDAAALAANALFKAARGGGRSFMGMIEGSALCAGIEGAVFGRMVTSDTAANIDGAAHVAHMLTVHEVETESDYFSVVDQLEQSNEESSASAAYLGNTELTSGLFYGYVVIDVPTLVSNLEGCHPNEWESADRTLAAEVVERLIRLIATVSPSAKRGSTAAYGYSELTLIEAGSRQPRSLARAFRKPLHPSQADEAGAVMADHLARMDRVYGQREARRMAAVYQESMPGAENVTMDELAAWINTAVQSGEAE